ncbi:MAG: hypothetical protein KF744_03290 [Taibaiella sp.]|nr:hypothetical protein [Taibaiella sp.]
MRLLLLIFLVLISHATCSAQRTVKLCNLWAEPQVHVKFGDYYLSFKIKDIDKALSLMTITGDSSFGRTSHLDESSEYSLVLYPGLDLEYHDRLQPLMQKGVGVFLLLAGHAEIKKGKRKVLHEIIADMSPTRNDSKYTYVNFFDPKTNAMLFSGRMNVAMYNQDLGID